MLRSAPLLTVLALASAGCGTLPATAADVARHADTFEIFALDPYNVAIPGPNSFAGHPILAKAKVADHAAQDRILDIVEEGMGKWATEAKCFNPRHGVRAIRGGKTVEIAICYECSNVEISVGDTTTNATTGDVRDALDAQFGALGVKTAK